MDGRRGHGTGRILRAGGLLLLGAAVGAAPLLQEREPPDGAAVGTPGGREASGSAPVTPETLERYRRAAEDSEDPLDHYNFGTALLRAGRPDEGRAALERSISSDVERLSRFGRYNYGLASAVAGRRLQEGGGASGRTAPRGEEPGEDVRERLLAARDAFREVLRDDPGDADARWNLELVERWLEEERQRSGEGSGQGPAGAGQGGAGAGSSAGGASEGSEAALGREEAEALLRAAGDAEAAIRERLMGQDRFRDPVVERNW